MGCGCAEHGPSGTVSLAIIAVAIVVAVARSVALWPSLGPTEEVRYSVVYEPACARAALDGVPCRFVYQRVR